MHRRQIFVPHHPPLHPITLLLLLPLLQLLPPLRERERERENGSDLDTHGHWAIDLLRDLVPVYREGGEKCFRREREEAVIEVR